MTSDTLTENKESISNNNNDVLIRIENLTKKYPVQRGFWSRVVGNVLALNNVSFNINKGEIIGVVGESGCGKSTLGKLILRLIEPSSGKVLYKDKDVHSISSKELRLLRQKLQIVFQNPYASLNPRMKIKDIITEPISVHKICKTKEEVDSRVQELLELVGLGQANQEKHPHELSGGQRQRIAIARSLSLNPEFLVLDEPVSALDVSVQAQILNLLLDLQKKLNLTYLFISHNLSVVSYISTHIAVMYLGNIVEFGKKDDIMNNPQHPYTKALLTAAPHILSKKERENIKDERIFLEGEIPDPSNIPSGCVFRTRCPIAKEKCTTEIPVLETHSNQIAACHYPGEL